MTWFGRWPPMFVPGFEFARSRQPLAGYGSPTCIGAQSAAQPARRFFGLTRDGAQRNPWSAMPRYTYSTIGLFRRELLDALLLRHLAGPERCWRRCCAAP
jgi:hypothetical protein